MSTYDIHSLTFSHLQTHMDNLLAHINTANDYYNDNDNFPVLETGDKTVDSTTTLRNGGRKKETTVSAKKQNEEVIKLLTTAVASEYLRIQKVAQSSGEKVKNHTLKKLIKSKEEQFLKN
jgi:hypothetical protein